jgi:hypothetical protein
MTTIGGIAQAAGDLLPDEVDLQAQSPLRFDKCNFLMALQCEVWYCSGQKSRLNGNIGGGGLFDIFEHRQPSGIVLLGGLLKGVHFNVVQMSFQQLFINCISWHRRYSSSSPKSGFLPHSDVLPWHFYLNSREWRSGSHICCEGGAERRRGLKNDLFCLLTVLGKEEKSL